VKPLAVPPKKVVWSGLFKGAFFSILQEGNVDGNLMRGHIHGCPLRRAIEATRKRRREEGHTVKAGRWTGTLDLKRNKERGGGAYDGERIRGCCGRHYSRLVFKGQRKVLPR